MANPDKSFLEMADTFCDMVFGPTPYRGVLMLERAADYCSDRAFATAMTHPEDIIAWTDACRLLADKAEALDNDLVNGWAGVN